VTALWFALVAFMFTMFVVLDGWDIGAGLLHLTVARTDGERRQLIAAIGPLWSWHEVWLVAAGAALLLAFPRVMTAAFSGFYLGTWLLLWSLLLRGVSIEVGGHLRDPLWRAWWDGVFAVSNVLLAVLLGAALGNVVRGVPLDDEGLFSAPLFTNFRTGVRPGLFDWYTLSVAAFATMLLAAHGATFLQLKTRGGVQARSARLVRRLWIAAAALLPAVTIETSIVRPELLRAAGARPAAWMAIAVVALGAWAIATGIRLDRQRRALAGSCAVIAGLLATTAAALFPVMLPSTLGAARSLTAENAAAAPHGLAIAIIWWPVAALLAITYLAIIARGGGGRSRAAVDTQQVVG
jgi:cytochrome bd ubiquinol oxidase subunit II